MTGTVDSMQDKLVTREEVLESALQYCRAGFSVIPCGRDKKPKIQWEEYIKRCATEDEVREWWRLYPYANVGLVTGMVSGFCVVDADGSVGVESLKQYIPGGVVTAYTPNHGQHFYFVCPDSVIGNATRFLPGVDFRGNGGFVVAPPSVGSNGKKYEWQLGCSLFEKDLEQLPADLLDVLNVQRIKSVATRTVTSDMFCDGRRDTDLFTTANTLFKTGMPHNEVEQIIIRLASTCNPPFTEKEAIAKVESAMKRAVVRERNLLQEVNDFVASTVGVFTVSDIYHFLNVQNKSEKFKVTRILNEFCVKRFIERASSSKNGMYRRLITEEEQIDFVHASSNLVNLKWPFHIEEYVQLMPKNLAVIAGTPNSGKTGFCLNMVYNNMDKFDIYYFSSEMGPTEFKSRLSKFDIPLESWRFTAIERAGDFHDVIRPNAINIIDFLEIHDEFFKTGMYMKQIYDRLENGVAIIALQRNKGNAAGLGGFRSLEKPRLYMNMSSDQVEIVKAKNWMQPEINPNGLRCKFHLTDGWRFNMTESWYRVGD